MRTSEVPIALKRWFIIHFAVDILVALPLMIAPSSVLSALGWTAIDPLASRLVAAALMAIGSESYLGRNATCQSYRGMLRLKIIWSGAAVVALLISIFTVSPVPGIVWGLLIIFLSFNLLWIHWMIRLGGKGDGMR